MGGWIDCIAGKWSLIFLFWDLISDLWSLEYSRIRIGVSSSPLRTSIEAIEWESREWTTGQFIHWYYCYILTCFGDPLITVSILTLISDQGLVISPFQTSPVSSPVSSLQSYEDRLESVRKEYEEEAEQMREEHKNELEEEKRATRWEMKRLGQNKRFMAAEMGNYWIVMT